MPLNPRFSKTWCRVLVVALIGLHNLPSTSLSAQTGAVTWGDSVGTAKYVTYLQDLGTVNGRSFRTRLARHGWGLEMQDSLGNVLGEEYHKASSLRESFSLLGGWIDSTINLMFLERDFTSVPNTRIVVRRHNNRTLNLVATTVVDIFDNGLFSNINMTRQNTPREPHLPPVPERPILMNLSPDTSTILLSVNRGTNADNSRKFELIVLDRQLAPRWRSIVALPHAVDVFRGEHFFVDNRGNVGLVGKLWPSAISKSRKVANHRYTVLRWGSDGELMDQSTLKLQGLSLATLHLNQAPNRRWLCSGTWSDPGSVVPKGVYTLAFNPDSGTVISSGHQQLDYRHFFETERDYKRSLTRNNLENLRPFSTAKFLDRPGGGWYICVEPGVTGFREGSQDSWWKLYSIQTLVVSSTYDLERVESIPKFQAASSWNFSHSYFVDQTNAGLDFLYYDRNPSSTSNQLDYTVLKHAHLPNSGKLRVKQLPLSDSYRIVPRHTRRIGSRSFRVLGKEAQIVRWAYPERLGVLDLP